MTTITLEALATQVAAVLAGLPAQEMGDATLDQALVALATRERAGDREGDTALNYWQ